MAFSGFAEMFVRFAKVLCFNVPSPFFSLSQFFVVSLPRISNESSMTQDNSIVIREYLTTDKEVVMNLIKLNTPNFFAKEEVNDLSNYLDKEIELYYVLLVDGKVVGCGGINFAEKRTIGKISWDIMHPDYQGKSLGKKLLRYRIEVLKAIPSIKKITVRTSQLAYKFYEKQGFTLNEIKRNYWADGFDMYSMQYNEL